MQIYANISNIKLHYKQFYDLKNKLNLYLDLKKYINQNIKGNNKIYSLVHIMIQIFY